jgi:hypothetical protein
MTGATLEPSLYGANMPQTEPRRKNGRQQPIRPNPVSSYRRRLKSLLVLFFRKEQSSLLPSPRIPQGVEIERKHVLFLKKKNQKNF